jgi:hypothetical protein
MECQDEGFLGAWKMLLLPLTKIFTPLHSKFEMPPIMKIMSSERMHNFYIGQF